jgi:hypothetical protein
VKRIGNLRQIAGNSLTRKGLLTAILLTTALLTAGYLLGELWLQTPVIFLLGILWTVCVLREIRWIASLLFFLLMGAAAVGYIIQLSHILMLAAGCTSVIAWDLNQFEGRLLDLDEPATKEMEKQHLRRAVIALGFSFLLITVDSLLHIRVQFIILVLLTILAILILNQVMLLVRKTGKPTPPKY